MSSLFQEPIRPFVRKQLRVREAILKQGNKGESRFTSNTVDLSDKNDGSETGRLPAGAFYTYTTSRQCVLRMSSGVDLLPDTEVPEKGKFEGNGVLEGENMAIRYILEGGVPAKNIDFGGIKTAQKDGYKQGPRNGFPGTNKSNFNQVGYGFHYGDPYIRSDAKEDMGIVPMPGIIDAQIQTQGRYGAIRTAKVNFKCHNRRQLEILELLYMRPGYPILLEWGWSTYISDDGAGTIKRQQEFPFISEFFEGNSTQEFINSIILENKAKTGGNYDGFLGVCKNFEIISRSDGGFDCTTDIMAMGEILEGLKGGDSGFTKKIEDKEYPVTDLEYYLYVLKEYIEGFAIKANGEAIPNQTAKTGRTINDGGSLTTTKPTLYPLNVEMHSTFKTIIKYFAELGNKGESERIDKLYTLTPETQKSIEDSDYTGKQKTEFTFSKTGNLTETTSGNYKNNDVAEYENSVDELEKYIDSFVLHRGEPLSVEGEEGLEGTKAGYNYVRWDFLVEILNNFIIDKVKDGGSTSASEPIVEISYLEQPLGKPLNERQYSTYSTFQFKKTSNKLFTPGNETPIDLEQLMDMSVDPAICLLPHQIISYKQLGKGENVFGSGKAPEKSIGKIFLNIDYLFNLYKTQEGKNFNLWDYINQIWTDVNVSCGGTHDFNVRTELERPHVVTISDYIVQNNQIDPNSIFEFKIQSNDSIVRDFNINSVIPSALSATAAVTAQAKSIESLNNVSFAAINKDIKSRFSKNVEKTISDSTVQRLSNEYTRDVNRLMDDILFLRDYKRDMLRGDFIEINEETGAQTNKLAIGYAKRVLNDIEKGVRSILSRFSENQYEEGSDTSQGPLPEPKYYKGEKKPNFNPPAKSAVIPLQFNALMDGVGGIKIGNVFKVDNTRLPKGYQGDDIAFVTWGESQMITAGQDWTTSIRGQLLSLDLGTEIDEEILDLTYRGIIDEVPETQEYSKESIDRIDEEQSDLDQSLAAIKIGDPLFLKINNSPTAVRNSAVVDNERRYSPDWDDNSIGLFKKGKAGLELGSVLEIKEGTATGTTSVTEKKIRYDEFGAQYVDYKTKQVEHERRTVWFLIDFYPTALDPSNFDEEAVLRVPLLRGGEYTIDLDGADGKWSDLDDLRKKYNLPSERKIGWMRWDTVMDGNPDQIEPTFEDKEIQLSYVQPLPEPFLTVKGIKIYLKRLIDREQLASGGLQPTAIRLIEEDGSPLQVEAQWITQPLSKYVIAKHFLINDPSNHSQQGNNELVSHEDVADILNDDFDSADILGDESLKTIRNGEERIIASQFRTYLTDFINDAYEAEGYN